MTYYTIAQLELATEECHVCHIIFAMPRELQRRALDDHSIVFYCPAGHGAVYAGKSTERKLEEARARETALRDQLHAAEVEAEQTRVRLLRDRHRFANGVCPCCNRSFGNVRRHMQQQHPDYDASEVNLPAALRYKCSCGRSFESPRGLAVHQGHRRGNDWTDPNQGDYWRHLTVIA